MAMLFLARSRAFRGLVLGTRVQLYCELDLAKRDVRRRSLRVGRAHRFQNAAAPETIFCASSFVGPEASRRSEDYVHARATASGTFPTSARVLSACDQPFLPLSLLI